MVIQRVQTLYLLLAVVCSIVMIFIPFAYSGEVGVTAGDYMALLVTVGGSALLSVVDIFLFKKSGLQKGIIVIAALLLIAAAVVMIVKVSDSSLSWGGGGLLLIASLIGLIAAYRGIAHDQKLLSSYDRIR